MRTLSQVSARRQLAGRLRRSAGLDLDDESGSGLPGASRRT
ncbi:hypothetical protein ABZS66_09505 [Dactylosporangium sp. NPDC005572]